MSIQPMAHSFTHLLYHIVFATKERRPCLDAAVRPELFAHLGQLVRAEQGLVLAINGVADHVHVLCRLRADRAMAAVVRQLKALSSRWLRQHVPDGAVFAWQTGYAAFSVSISQADTVRAYVQNQERRHRRMTFAEEYDRLLRAHGLAVPEGMSAR